MGQERPTTLGPPRLDPHDIAVDEVSGTHNPGPNAKRAAVLDFLVWRGVRAEPRSATGAGRFQSTIDEALMANQLDNGSGKTRRGTGPRRTILAQTSNRFAQVGFGSTISCIGTEVACSACVPLRPALTLLVLTVSTGAALAGCGTTTRDSGSVCGAAGQRSPCVCPGGPDGTQACRENGAWSDCDCSSPFVETDGGELHTGGGTGGNGTTQLVGGGGAIAIGSTGGVGGGTSAGGSIGDAGRPAIGDNCIPGTAQRCLCEDGSIGRMTCSISFILLACMDCAAAPSNQTRDCLPGSVSPCLCDDNATIGTSTCTYNGIRGICTGCDAGTGSATGSGGATGAGGAMPAEGGMGGEAGFEEGSAGKSGFAGAAGGSGSPNGSGGAGGGGASGTCWLPLDPGTCEGSISRWGFDPVMGCVPFTWGGCDGNANNFASEDECRAECECEVPNLSWADCACVSDDDCAVGMCFDGQCPAAGYNRQADWGLQECDAAGRCPNDLVCDRSFGWGSVVGRCVECVTDADCPTQNCLGGTCLEPPVPCDLSSTDLPNGCLCASRDDCNGGVCTAVLTTLSSAACEEVTTGICVLVPPLGCSCSYVDFAGEFAIGCYESLP